MQKSSSNQTGSILVSLIIVLPSLILIAAHYLQLSVASFRIARIDQFRTHAQFGADAGIDYALQEINNDEDWIGTASPAEIHNDSNIRVTYEVVVTTNNNDSKTITSYGRTYSPVTDTTPDSTVTLNVDLRAIPTGSFSVVTGVGGLYLSNSAKIVGGDVFVNGEIHLQNSAQIGLTTNPVDVRVAHQTCPDPPDATYPQLCASGENGEPISIQNTAHIYGSVTANNQTTGTAMSNPGLVASSGVEAEPLPVHDRNAQKNAVAVEQTGAASSCTSQNSTRSWPANLKITGDVEVSNNCIVTVNGDVWITGKLEVKNQAELRIIDGLGTTRPQIMVDGLGTKLSNSSKIVSNASDTGARLVAYWSAADCTPDCADVTGQDLFDSRNQVTIELDNTAEGPETIFYSRWSRVLISNSGQIGALIGQTVELKNSGTITFGTSTGTGQTYWVIDGYRRQF